MIKDFRIANIDSALYRIDNKHAFLAIPKNATRHVLHTMGYMNPGPPRPMGPDEIVIRDMMRVTAIWRDPRERFFSGFVEMCSRQLNRRKEKLDTADLTDRLNAFNEDYLQGKRPWIDEHVLPQSWYLEMYKPESIWAITMVDEWLRGLGYEPVGRYNTMPKHLRGWCFKQAEKEWPVVEALI